MRLNNSNIRKSYLLWDDTHSLANCDQLEGPVSKRNSHRTMGPDWLHSDELGQSEWDCPVLFQDIQDLDNVLRFILMLLFYFNVYFTLSSSIILALTHTSIFSFAYQH